MPLKSTAASAHPFLELRGSSLAITEHAPLPMATVEGPTHIFRYGNPAFCELMGTPLHELVGKPFAQLLPENDACVTLLARVFGTGRSESYTVLDPVAAHPVFWSYTVWPLQAGEGLVGVMIQVTETAKVHGATVAMNEALVLGSLRQHELTEAAERLNTQLRTEIAERKRAGERLRILWEAARVLLSADDPDTLLRGLLAKIGPSLGVDAYLNSMVAPGADGPLHLTLWGGLPEGTARLIEGLDFGPRIGGPMTTVRQPVHTLDLQGSDDPKARLIKSSGFLAFVCNPLLSGDVLLGTLSYASRSKEEFDLEEIAVLQTLSHYVAAAYARMRATAALRASEERYRALFNSIDEGFCVIEMFFDENENPVDYRYLEVNPTFEKQTGLADAVGKCVSELVPGIEAYWRETYGKVALTGEPVRFVKESKTMGRWFDLYAFRLGGATSRRVAVVFTDITERKRTEEIRGRLAAIVDSSIDAIIGHTLTGVVTSWNAGAERLFGYKAADIIDLPITVLIPLNKEREEAEMRARAVRGERIENFETIRIAQDGRAIEVSLSISPIVDGRGTIVGFSKIVHDITNQRQIARELERVRDEAMAASRAKDVFLAALSHELRTPLTPVLLLASDAAENKSLPDDVRADFDTIRKNVTLEARLIDDLLDITRVSRGKLSLQPQLCDMHAVLRDVLTIVRHDLDEKRIRLSFDLVAEQASVMGDPVRLQQILWNVLRNAVHFTPEDGLITLASVTDRARDQFVLKITDTGVGIAPADLPRIFETFSQGDNAGTGTSRRFGSLGLGLAISRTLVELHAGSIDALSEGRGTGSTFVITLPLLSSLDSTSASSAPFEPPAHESARTTIVARTREPLVSRGLMLIVEDHAPTRLTLQRLLERRQFNVLTASSLAEAVTLANREPVDFVISDIGLPDGDGYTLIAQLLAARPRIQGLALSGYGTEADIARSRHAGFSNHLTKPVNIHTLDQALERLVARNDSETSSG